MKRVFASTVALLLVVAASSLFLRASSVVVPSGTWAPTGDLNGIRAGAAAVLLSDGAVLVTGGSGADGRVASAERYSVSGGTFIATESMQVARANHTATVLGDGRVLVVGGFGADGAAASSAEIYNPATNVWMSAGSLAHARAGHTATLLPDGRVLVAGGESGEGALATLEVYSPVFEQFSVVGAPMTAARMRHAAALAGKKVLITGGWNGAAALASVDVFDPANDSVAAGPSMSSARAEHTATTLLSGNVLVAGGMAAGDLQSAEVFDVAAGGFVPTASMAAARRNHIAILLPHNNSVLIAGGWSAGAASRSAELYRAWQDGGIFVSTGSSLAPRNWSAGGALSFAASATNRGGPADGLVLVAGGDGAATAELYGFATVKTDKDDYQPGDVVYVSGSGWLPNQSVSFYVRELPAEHYARLVTIDADGAGNISGAKLFDVEEHHLGVRFLLTAADGVSQAHMTFTDSNNFDITPLTQSVTAGSTNTFIWTFAATNSGSQQTTTFTVPTGWTAPQIAAGAGQVTVTGSGTSPCNVSLQSIVGMVITIRQSAPAPTTGTCANNSTFTLTYANATAPSPAAPPQTYAFASNHGSPDPTITVTAANDTTAPIVTLTTPANGSTSNDSTPTFSGVGGLATGDGADITVKIYSGPTTAGTLLQTLAATRNATTGIYSVDAAALADGTYTAQAQQSDMASNTGFSSANTFTVDTVAPLISLVTPANGSSINDTTPSLSGVAGILTGDATAVTVKIYSGATVAGVPIQTLPTTRDGSGNYSVDAAALTDGLYTAQATQADAAGNLGTSTANTFTVDMVAPLISLVTPANGSSINDMTPSLSGVAGMLTGDATAVTVKIYSGATASGVPVQTLPTTRDGSGNYSVDAAALTDGIYTAQATQADDAGNVGTSTANTFTIDTVAPLISLVAPANGSSINDTTPTFSGVAGILTGDATAVSVKIYSGATASGVPVQTLPTTRDGSGNYSVDAAAALADGIYTAQATQADDAGNVGTSTANTFTIDTVAPLISLVAPANGSSISDATPSFSGVAGVLTGDAPAVTVTIYSGSTATGPAVQTLAATRDGSGNYTVNATALTDGIYTAQATQADAAGNVGTSTANTFTVDTAPPVVSLVTPVNGSSIGDATPSFSGVAGILTGDSPAVTVTIYSGSTATGSAVQTLAATRDGSGNYTIDAAALTDGIYTAQATQADAAGNVGTSTANTFTVDTVAPVISLVTPANGSSTNNTTPTFSGVAGILTGDSTAVTVTIYSGSTATGAAVQTLAATRDGSGSYSVVAAVLANGIYTAQATQTDAASNVGTSTPNTFTVDTIAPVVTLVTPPNGSATNDTTPTLSGVAGILTGDATAVTVKIYSGSTASGVPVQTHIVPRNALTGAYAVDATVLANGTYTARSEQVDAAGNTGISAANTFVVDTAAPTVTNTSASPNPVALGTPTTITAMISDAATGNTNIVSADYSLDGGLTWAGPMAAIDGFNSPTENVTKTLLLATGVYNVCVRGTDAAGNVSVINAANSANACTLLAVYDPTAGFVTGGGWINSPAGAYTQDPTLIGRANFGFVSKFQRGRNNVDELTGQTQFQFQAGNLNFHSTAYQWLVVSGARGQFKGTGTINGVGGYEFLLTGVDAQVVGGGDVDRFRIKITLNGSVVYDNQLGADDTSALLNPGTIVQGSIVIHSAKK